MSLSDWLNMLWTCANTGLGRPALRHWLYNMATKRRDNDGDYDDADADDDDIVDNDRDDDDTNFK